ncbi:MAG: pilus assembly PilX family protein, partial [Pseudomonadales bacterium]
MNALRRPLRALRSSSAAQPFAAGQRGVALFISLVLLLVLTIIGVSAVQTTSLEVRMARNDYDSLLAFEAAESALRDAENQIEGILNLAGFSDGGANGLWNMADVDETPRLETANLWTGALSIIAPTVVDEVQAQPRFIIEHAATVQRLDSIQIGNYNDSSGVPDRIEMFRITARGVGGTAQAAAML